MSDDDLDLMDTVSDNEDFTEDEMIAKGSLSLDGRSRVEQKMEELRLQRLTQDYDFI